MSALDPILERTRSEVARRQVAVPISEVEAAAAAREEVRSFTEALAQPGLSIIAEHKRRSPSAGLIRDDLELEAVVGAYERGGASALSVLTETGSFGGSLTDLQRARGAAALPILRKDFIIDSYQVAESRAAGADAILLIVAALAVDELEALYARARALGLGVLVEVHDEAELETAAALGAEAIGINNRDLVTLEVDVSRTLALRPRIPAGILVVAESGFRTRPELDRLAAAGVDAALIGEALMRAGDIEAACRALAGGRAAREL